MIAQDLMTENPVTILATAPLHEAIQLLQDLDVRHLPVVDHGLSLVGMLRDRDLRALTLPKLINNEWVGAIRTRTGSFAERASGIS